MKKLLLVLAMVFIAFGVVSCDEEVTTEKDYQAQIEELENYDYWIIEIMHREDQNEDGLYTYYVAEYGDSSTYREEVYMRNYIESDKLFSVGELVLCIEIQADDGDYYILEDFDN